MLMALLVLPRLSSRFSVNATVYRGSPAADVSGRRAPIRSGRREREDEQTHQAEEDRWLQACRSNAIVEKHLSVILKACGGRQSDPSCHHPSNPDRIRAPFTARVLRSCRRKPVGTETGALFDPDEIGNSRRVQEAGPLPRNYTGRHRRERRYELIARHRLETGVGIGTRPRRGEQRPVDRTKQPEPSQETRWPRAHTSTRSTGATFINTVVFGCDEPDGDHIDRRPEGRGAQ